MFRVDVLDLEGTVCLADGDPASVAVIVAHPDDESVGVGAHLDRLRNAHFLFVTDGSPRDLGDARAAGFAGRSEYAAARREERQAAFEYAGIPEERVVELGLVDREAMYELPALTRSVAAFVQTCEPDVILTHPYEGGHPDHDACAFAVHFARAEARRAGLPAPRMVEMAFYNGFGGNAALGSFLPGPPQVLRTVLTERMRRLKEALFACYESQRCLLARFPLDAECLRAAPDYDFSAPPHAGRLLYETFGFGISGAEWLACSQRALLRLGAVADTSPPPAMSEGNS